MDRRSFLNLGAAAGAGLAAAAWFDPDRVYAQATAPWTLGLADVEDDVAPHKLRRLHGRRPAGLEGALYRNGPAKFRRPGRSVGHWFDGDGMVRAWTLAGGEATLAARFVDTPKRRIETSAKACVMPGFGTKAAPGSQLEGPDDSNAANTSVIRVGDALWALWEGGSPAALDPVSLETKGFAVLRQDLKSMPFSAHPRREASGRLWNFGWWRDQVVVWRLSPQGALEDARIVKLPRASYIHDFTATDRHLIFVLQPWVQERMAMPFNSGFAWRPEQGTQVVVIDKADLDKRRVFELPPFFFFHLGDAWAEADGTIRFDACIDPDPSFAVTGAAKLLSGEASGGPAPRLALVTLGADGKARLEQTSDAAEFPRNDPRYAGLAGNMTVHTVIEPGRPLSRGIATRDWRGGKAQAFDFGLDHLVEEFVFAPRPGGSAAFDGWLVGTTLNLKAKASELHVFDARRVADGPVCSLRAEAALPVSFHGNFVRG